MIRLSFLSVFFVTVMMCDGIAQNQSTIPLDCPDCLVKNSIVYNSGEDLFNLGLTYFTIAKKNNSLKIRLEESGDTMLLKYSYDPLNRSGHMNGIVKDSLAYFNGDFFLDSNLILQDWQMEDPVFPGTYIPKKAPCYILKKEGVWIYFNNLDQRRKWIQEKQVSWKNGIRSGVYEERLNGTITNKGYFVNDRQVGVWVQNNGSGLRSEMCYSLDGFKVYSKVFFPDTNSVMIETINTRYLNHNNDSVYEDSTQCYTRTFYKTGKLKSESFISFVDAKQESIVQYYTSWYPDGALKVKIENRNGTYSAQQWYETGQIKAEEFYCTLNVSLLDSTVEGQLCGKASYWDRTGKPIKKKP